MIPASNHCSDSVFRQHLMNANPFNAVWDSSESMGRRLRLRVSDKRDLVFNRAPLTRHSYLENTDKKNASREHNAIVDASFGCRPNCGRTAAVHGQLVELPFFKSFTISHSGVPLHRRRCPIILWSD
jgi:hypothetical protein